MFDDKLLESFIHAFFGYGHLQADFWFIGMEEGGGKTSDEISDRLKKWNERGRHELENLEGFHRAINAPQYFEPERKLQPTWSRLTRVLLSSKGIEPTDEAVRSYQSKMLGKPNGETCLMELLPLPSRSSNQWDLYSSQSRLPYLVSRDVYASIVRPPRIAHLRAALVNHPPKVLVFYGTSNMRWWREIAGQKFRREPAEVASTAWIGDSLLVVMKHPNPARRAIPHEYLDKVGRLIAEKRELRHGA